MIGFTTVTPSLCLQDLQKRAWDPCKCHPSPLLPSLPPLHISLTNLAPRPFINLLFRTHASGYYYARLGKLLLVFLNGNYSASDHGKAGLRVFFTSTRFNASFCSHDRLTNPRPCKFHRLQMPRCWGLEIVAYGIFQPQYLPPYHSQIPLWEAPSPSHGI